MSLTHTNLDFGFAILAWGSFAQQGFQAANYRILCFNRYYRFVHRLQSTVVMAMAELRAECKGFDVIRTER
jgi:hypothetical protein